MDFSEKPIFRRKRVLLLALLISVGFFLRSYNFSDWLHFEIDQSYDTLLVTPAIEDGIGNLPLLGPTAGGGRALRLGPAFYYMEYLSAEIFGNTPPGHATIVLITSVLSIPLFYLFSRRYFSRSVSTGLLALYSLSLYMVCYGRFSWSPNVLPFLTILGFYALLRSLSEDEKTKDRWFLVAATTLIIATQIHFNAFFIVPAVVIPLLLIRRPKFKLRTWVGTLLIFGAVYSPVIISDIATGGENFGYFLEKFRGNSERSVRLNEKLAQVVHYHASEYFLIVTGIDHVNGKRLTGYGFLPEKEQPWRIAAIVLLVTAIIILFYRLRTETRQEKKDFLWLITAWFVVSFAYFFFVKKSGLNIYPRFFLAIAPIPFVFFGLFLEQLARIRRVGMPLLIAAVFIPILTNTSGLFRHFSQLNTVGKEPLTVDTEDIFPNTARVTLSQQHDITGYIESVSRENGYPVYLQAKHEYEPVIWYHLEQRGIPYYGKIHKGTLYEEGNYFIIKFARSTLDKDEENTFNLIERKDFGALSVFRLDPKRKTAADARQNPDTKEISIQSQQIGKIFTWNKLLTGEHVPPTEETAETNHPENTSEEFSDDTEEGSAPSDSDTDASE